MPPTLPDVTLTVREPPKPPHLPPLLFLHGAWHGAWCWERFMAFFAEEGFPCFAFDLDGHGEAARPRDFDRRLVRHHLPALRSAIRQVESRGRPYLIGHSMGGWLIQMLLADSRAHEVEGAVLLAPVPSSGVPIRTSLKIMVQYPLIFARPLLLRSMPIKGTRMARRFFHLPDKPEGEVAASAARLRPEGAMACLDLVFGLSRVNPAKIRRTPTILVAAAHDYFFPLASERRLADRLGAELLEFPDMAHNMMEDGLANEVAAAIRDWIDRTHRTKNAPPGSNGG